MDFQIISILSEIALNNRNSKIGKKLALIIAENNNSQNLISEAIQVIKKCIGDLQTFFGKQIVAQKKFAEKVDVIKDFVDSGYGEWIPLEDSRKNFYKLIEELQQVANNLRLTKDSKLAYKFLEHARRISRPPYEIIYKNKVGKDRYWTWFVEMGDYPDKNGDINLYHKGTSILENWQKRIDFEMQKILEKYQMQLQDICEKLGE